MDFQAIAILAIPILILVAGVVGRAVSRRQEQIEESSGPRVEASPWSKLGGFLLGCLLFAAFALSACYALIYIIMSSNRGA